MAGTGSYIAPRLTQAGQIIITPNSEPRSLSDLINFTQKSSLTESQLGSLSANWEQALRAVNRYFGTSQLYKESCTNYICAGGPPTPRDVEIATIAVGTGPTGVAVDPTNNRIYVPNILATSLSVIDGTSNTVLTTIGVGTRPIAAGFNPTNKLVYVSNFGANSVTVINATTNAVLTTITVGIGAGPAIIGVNPTTNRIYVVNGLSNSVAVIDGSTNTVLTTITVGTFPAGIAVNPTTNRIYVVVPVHPGISSVSVINGTSNTVLTTIPVGDGAFGVAVNPTTNRIYVANQFTSPPSVSVIDGTNNGVFTTIPVVGAYGVGVNPATNRVYVTTGLSTSALSVINGTTNALLNIVILGTIGQFPYGIGVNPTNNHVYVDNGGDATLSVIGQREEIRESCLVSSSCLVISSIGTLFPGTPQSAPVSLVAASFRSNTTKTGTQMALTVVCDNNTTSPSQQCSALYVDGNVWGPGQTDLSKSPFIIQNAEPYFYLQFHWWDFANSRIFTWGTWWYGTASNPNWFWGVYWSWRTYVNYYIGISYIPWWWWSWHWTYWRYWAWWGTAFQT